MRFPGQKIPPPTVGSVPLPTIPPPDPERRVEGAWTRKLDLFLPEQKSAYDVDHFNYNFEVLERFSSGRMMFAGYVNAETCTTVHLSINAKLLLKRLAEKQDAALSVIAAIERGELPLVGNDDRRNVGGPRANEGNYYIVSARHGEGEMFSLWFKPGDWLVSTGEGWAKIDNNGISGGAAGVEIEGGNHIEVVEDGDRRIINYMETWKPVVLP